MSKEHRVYATACRASLCEFVEDSSGLSVRKLPPNRVRLYFAINAVVAVGRLGLIDQHVAVVGTVDFELMTSCVWKHSGGGLISGLQWNSFKEFGLPRTGQIEQGLKTVPQTVPRTVSDRRGNPIASGRRTMRRKSPIVTTDVPGLLDHRHRCIKRLYYLPGYGASLPYSCFAAWARSCTSRLMLFSRSTRTVFRSAGQSGLSRKLANAGAGAVASHAQGQILPRAQARRSKSGSLIRTTASSSAS